MVPAVAGSSPLFVLLYYWTVRAIPGELFESARLDGADGGVIWWCLVRPLCRPTTAVVSILSFVMYWGDFVSPILYTYDTTLYTLPVGLQILNQLDATNWPVLMAGAVIMVMPMILLLVWGQSIFLKKDTIASLWRAA